MIRPLRHRHRWLIACVMAVLIVAFVLAVTHRPPDSVMDALPPALR